MKYAYIITFSYRISKILIDCRDSLDRVSLFCPTSDTLSALNVFCAQVGECYNCKGI